MTDDVLPTAALLPIGPTAHSPHSPQSVSAEDEDEDTWDVVHEGTADTPDHGAQALMRTSDGDFRISAAEVEGKVGLKIERLHPHETPDGDDAAAPDPDPDQKPHEDIADSDPALGAQSDSEADD